MGMPERPFQRPALPAGTPHPRPSSRPARSFSDVIPDGAQRRAGIQTGAAHGPLDPRFALCVRPGMTALGAEWMAEQTFALCAPGDDT